MPPTFAEFKALQLSGESTGRVHTPALETALGMIKTAAVSFEHLTNTEHWDRFLSYLQPMLEEAKKESRYYMDLTLNNDGDAQKHAQRMYHRADANVQLLNTIMDLPNKLMMEYQQLKPQ